MTYIKLNEELKKATKKGLLDYASFLCVDVYGMKKIDIRSTLIKYLSDVPALTEKTYQLHINILRGV